jgi:hypothetical protein
LSISSLLVVEAVVVAQPQVAVAQVVFALALD